MNEAESEGFAADVVREYDAQGHHRTGTDADHASARWLQGKIRQMGAEPILDDYKLSCRRTRCTGNNGR